MSLFERVATLVRANLNDLVDKAENPEKTLKQVILDMENQFMQVKTQLAIALADLHLLQKKQREHGDRHAEWMTRAELAVEKKDDELARAALGRTIASQQLADGVAQQIASQEAEVESLKSALKRLEDKLAEARSKAELLIVRHRRARAAQRVANARQTPHDESGTFARMRSKVSLEENLAQATNEILSDDIESRFDALERERKIDSMLQEIKARKGG